LEAIENRWRDFLSFKADVRKKENDISSDVA